MNICVITGFLCALLAGRQLIQLIRLRMEEENLVMREKEKVEK